MRIFLAILSGFVLTLVLFASGAATAIYFLNANPAPERSFSMNTAAAWTSDPVRVETVPRESEPSPASRARRPPGVAQVGERTEQAEDVALDEELVDMTTTGAIPSEAEADVLPLETGPGPQAGDAAMAAHVAWCSERYRSYRPGENAYTAYSGEKRECVSPYSEAVEASVQLPAPETGASVERSGLGYAVADEAPARLSPEHVQSCFERYRSYRVEDNTYQPYGGGPRRQCR